jgi:hypothetical protein
MAALSFYDNTMFCFMNRDYELGLVPGTWKVDPVGEYLLSIRVWHKAAVTNVCFLDEYVTYSARIRSHRFSSLYGLLSYCRHITDRNTFYGVRRLCFIYPDE